ncbi:50S ribosomal protein L13 [Desulfurispirillum indicum]|uniref:Large ribosomal subunit protein uL13 n=1 Tax=Desulfurispirillum indicum (strain ATCC BAA-1389 / DSM 22839 / S5) TaxID=653733 RepID=E6W2Y9_DESIS|nr:50S ribosomal protein L13 [Desulfurispirillum indicum]ADU66814.1 ribosomal protein L13 [Desulfurispirillum indicum S5]UCZ56134.1 50S ribosomal protein L13 [Desulfurispirillum indicum]
MKTYVSKGDIEKKWYLVDAEGKSLGRLSTEIARILRGKHKVTFTPHMNDGDYVVVVNADKIEVSGRKAEQKVYYHHTWYTGGLKAEAYKDLLARKPEEVITKAVKGMLPKNKLADKMIKQLRVYAGPEHPHAGANPQPLNF